MKLFQPIIDGNTEGYLDIDGGRIWYKVYGADKQGIPLIVVHGGPGLSYDYLEPLKELADERPVIFYDQLGCGNSSKNDNTSKWCVEYFGLELAQVCKHFNFKQVHILGHSFAAAAVVYNFLEAKCDLISTMILASPCLSGTLLFTDICKAINMMPEGFRIILSSVRIANNSAYAKHTQEQFIEASAAFFNRFLCRLDVWPDCLNRSFEKLNYEMYNHIIGPSVFNFNGKFREFDITDKLGVITVPVLLTWGAYEYFSPETIAFYRTKIPKANSVTFSKSSHMAHLEETEAYVKTIRDFLVKHDTV